MAGVKPTKEQFEDYIRIRDSGITNMFAISIVCDLSTTGLTRDNCYYIMDNFKELAEIYNVAI